MLLHSDASGNLWTKWFLGGVLCPNLNGPNAILKRQKSIINCCATHCVTYPSLRVQSVDYSSGHDKEDAWSRGPLKNVIKSTILCGESGNVGEEPICSHKRGLHRGWKHFPMCNWNRVVRTNKDDMDASTADEGDSFSLDDMWGVSEFELQPVTFDRPSEVGEEQETFSTTDVAEEEEPGSEDSGEGPTTP